MSGGSLDYLYTKEAGELFDRVESMEQAESFLIGHGILDVAKDVRRLIEYVKSAEIRINTLKEQLNEVLWAIEWCIDCDISYSDVEEAIEQYREYRRKNEGI